MVRVECERWGRKGINVTYQIRDDRKGYKAGALRAGMKHAYVRECEYVVIFDADFQPEPDFLKRTIPYLVHNPKVALVQARWRFGTWLTSQRCCSLGPCLGTCQTSQRHSRRTKSFYKAQI
jgi:cellulose synthase/poly-beta-1,6-N-acetylglucosamine synthase-like glycosyltransferase